MKRLFCILTLLYYSIGALILPASDFSILPELQQTYSHCQSTEDKDMNFADFITDHLMNIDGVFDHHNNGDEQKPHKPLEHQTSCPIVFIPSPLHYEFKPMAVFSGGIVCPTDKTYHFEFVGDLFRPPIA